MKDADQQSFGNSVRELAELAKAVSHPARISIIKILSGEKEQSCQQLVDVLPLSQATVSQHLKALLDSGFICRRNLGPKSLYCLEWNKVERLFLMFERMEKQVMPHRPKRNCC